MSIQIYNTLTRKKEPLQTIEDGHVKLYVCGITSYDYCHIGHARSALAFDMIVRYLRFKNYKVTYIRNFTDIDDKIIKRATEQNTTTSELANRFINEFYIDMDNLGIDRPTYEPKATEHIQEMIDLILELINKDMAYQSGNDVYYSVNSFEEYGKLSGRNLEDMQAGARISINEEKRDPMDFALWKGSKEGEPFWESPWGKGRPGWHIECSAMSKKYLGDTFDIHGGGKDLIFPHHENELAQSEGANGKPFAHTWIHHGFVTISDEKMSKSLGNFLTIREILEHYHPEILRFFIFSTQYRNPLDFSEKAMQNAASGLERLYKCVASLTEFSPKTDANQPSSISKEDFQKLNSLEDRFCQAMDNDFNTAQAQGIIFDIVKVLNKNKKQLPNPANNTDVTILKDSASLLKSLVGIMGLLQEEPKSYLDKVTSKKLASQTISEDEINKLIQERHDARKIKDWARSDEIRDELLSHNIAIKDSANGTTWEVI